MKRILITGPLGHIGSAFLHETKKGEYDEIRLLDNFYTQRYSSLFNLPKGVRFNFLEDDVCTANLKDYFRDIDTIIHLAAITNAEESFKIRQKVEEVNFEGTKRVAEACLECGCKLIFPSTTSVYGTQKEIVDENCSPGELKPQSPYAESKLKAEKLLEKLGGEKGLRYIICRFATVFGTSPGMRFHTAINKFIWQACTGKALTVWRAALNQKRPYLDLKDAIAALKFIIERDIFTNTIYNVLTLNATVSDIINTIKIFVPGLEIKFVDSRVMNQLSYTVSCEKFRKEGFETGGNLKKGIADTVNLLQGLR